MKKLQSLVKIAALSVATVFALTQPAKAVLFNTFEFTDEDGLGTGRVPGETVTGTITFDSLNPGDTATGVAADSVVVDSIPNWLDSSWGDVADLNVGINIVPFINGEVSNFNNPYWSDSGLEVNNFEISSGVITGGNFLVVEGNEDFWLLRNGNLGLDSVLVDNLEDLSYARDIDSSSLTFSQTSASVPFEFSPTLGLFLVGGVFSISRYAKSRKAAKLIDN